MAISFGLDSNLLGRAGISHLNVRDTSDLSTPIVQARLAQRQPYRDERTERALVPVSRPGISDLAAIPTFRAELVSDRTGARYSPVLPAALVAGLYEDSRFVESGPRTGLRFDQTA